MKQTANSTSKPRDAPRLVFITDIPTPYTIAVQAALARELDLRVLFCSQTGSRGAPWSFRAPLPFEHEVVGGAMIRRRHPDATDFYLSPRLLRSLYRHRPDAVIVGGYSIPTLYASLYCAERVVPLLIHSDGTVHSERPHGRLQRWARQVLVPRAAAAIANSGPAAERFEQLGFSASRIFMAPHATDVARLRAVGERRVVGDAGRLNVLVTGRLIARKGIDRLMPAFAAASAARPGLSLTLVGSGPEEGRLRSLAASLDLANVDFRGFVDQEGLPSVYAAADVYAFPSVDDSFGMVLLEAAAAALPVIASPLAGATLDLITDEVTGLVRDPDDVDGWVEALVRLADDPGLRERLGRAAYSVTRSRTPETTASGYAHAVKETLATWPGQ